MATVVTVATLNPVFPRKCLSCLAMNAKDEKYGEDLVIATTGFATVSKRVQLNVPLCAACSRKPKMWLGAGIALTSLMLIGVMVGSIVTKGQKIAPRYDTLLAIAAMVLAVVCVSCFIVWQKKRPVKILEANEGTITLRFSNAAYAEEFRAANPEPREGDVANRKTAQ